MNAIALALALAMTGQCYGPACRARFRARPLAPVVVAAPPVVVAAPAYVTPVLPAYITPSPTPPVPAMPLPAGCRYIWNGYMWVVACY